jgi:hypothetical protein
MVAGFSQPVLDLLVCNIQNGVQLLISGGRGFKGRPEDEGAFFIGDGLLGEHPYRLAVAELLDDFVHEKNSFQSMTMMQICGSRMLILWPRCKAAAKCREKA